MSKPASISIGRSSCCGDGGRAAEPMHAARRFAPGQPKRGHSHVAQGGHSHVAVTVKRNGLSGVSRHRDANEVPIADNAVGRVEFNPARSWQVDLTPRIRGAAAEMALPRIATGHVEIAGDKAGSEAERP